MTKKENSSFSYIPTLDGWRAIAVLLVIYSHSKMLFASGEFFENDFLYKFSDFGLKGVDIFFAISGYLICSRLVHEEKIFGKISLKSFYLRRFFRLFPASVFYLLIVFLIGNFNLIEVKTIEFISCLSFWRNYIDLPVNFSATGHFWSLSVEEHFYLLFPVTLLFIKRNRTPTYLFFIFLISLWRKFDMAYSPLSFIDESLKYHPFHTIPRLDGLLWGCLFTTMREEGRMSISWLNNKWTIPLTLMTIFTIRYEFPLKHALLPLVLISLVYSTVNDQKGIFSKFLETPILRFLGKISFSLYLWQQLFIFKASVNHGSLFAQIAGSKFSWLLILLASALCYYLIERPIRKIGYRKYAENS